MDQLGGVLCLIGFDDGQGPGLYAGGLFDGGLLKWNGSAWVSVARSESATSSETISYAGTSGYYMWQVYSYSGSGSYNFWTLHP